MNYVRRHLLWFFLGALALLLSFATAHFPIRTTAVQAPSNTQCETRLADSPLDRAKLPAELAAVFNKKLSVAARMQAVDDVPSTARSAETLAALRQCLWRRSENEGVRNNVADKLRGWQEEHLVKDLTAMLWDAQETPKWRNYCVQHLYTYFITFGDREILETLMEAAEDEENMVVAGALWSLARIASSRDASKLPDAKTTARIHEMCLTALRDENAEMLVRIAGVQSCACLRAPDALAVCRKLSEDTNPKSAYLRMVAIAAIGDLGDLDDADKLRAIGATDRAPLIKDASNRSVDRIRKRVTVLVPGAPTSSAPRTRSPSTEPAKKQQCLGAQP
ncbi:MAG TPA: hypothetical protein VGP72_05395 [Planctomycetota bacterium]